MNEVEAIFLTAFVAALIAAWGVVTQRLITRRVTTIQRLADNESDKDLIDAAKKFNELTNDGGKLAQYCHPNDLSDEETSQVKVALNSHELMAIGIYAGIYDLNIVKMYKKGTIIRDWSRAAPFIYKLRSELSNPFIYYEFENLAHWLQDNNGRPKRRIWTRLWF